MKVTTLGAAGSVANRYLYERLPGRWAQLLLQNPDFEPDIPSLQRLHAALSLETEQQGGMLIRNKLSGQVLLAKTSFLLCAAPPSKLAFAVSFHDLLNADSNGDLYTLVFHNEFQYILGCYLHAQSVFLFYSPNDLTWATRFIEKEKIEPIFSFLDELGSTPFLARAVREGPIGHAAAIGFNNSFGHAHWNDIIGVLNRSEMIASRQLRPLLSSVLVGPQMWISSGQLIELPAINFASANECSSWCLQERISIHLPIGFRIHKNYCDFWQQTVLPQVKPSFQSAFSAWQGGRWPIILFCLRFVEQKRPEWREREIQILALMDAIRALYPDAGFILDGLTSRHEQADAPSVSAPDAQKLLSESQHAFWLHGETVANKIFAYKHVDFFIGQFGSGTLLPAYVYATPGVSITNQEQIIETYSQKSFITNLARPEAYKPNIFLPIECIDNGETDFMLDVDAASTYILSMLEDILRDGKSNSQLLH